MAFELLEHMRSIGVRPNAFTFTSLIGAVAQQSTLPTSVPHLRPFHRAPDACGKAHELERAFDVLATMQTLRVQPDGPTFTTLIS